MPRKSRRKPRERVEDWPGEPTGVADVDVAITLADNLKRAMGTRSSRDVQRLTGVDYTSINDILNGGAWPGARTIARLEAGLGVDLWPRGVAKSAGPVPADVAAQ